MAERSLEIKKFIIYPQYIKNQPYDLDNIEGIDLYELLKEHWHNYVNAFDQKWESNDADEPKRSFRITEINDTAGNSIAQIKYRDNLRYIAGKVSTGHYGQGGEVIDEDKNVVFNIKPTHAVPRPFFFLICIPSHSKVGYYITEKDKIYGISQTLHILLKDCIQRLLLEKTFAVQNFVEDAIVRRHINEGIYDEVTLTTSKLRTGPEERYGITHYENSEYIVELRIRAKNKQRGILGDLKQKIVNAYNGQSDDILNFTNGFSEIGIDNTSVVTIKTSHNGVTRKIQLDNPNKLRSLYKISVNLDADGHTNFGSIETECVNLLNSFELNIFPHGN